VSNYKRHDPNVLVKVVKELQKQQGNPEPPATGPSCARCEHMLMRRTSPTQIEPSMLCIRMPPSTTMIPGPQGVAQLTGFPIVNPGLFCHEFKEKADDGSIAPAH
jgi:hypothetical protein